MPGGTFSGETTENPNQFAMTYLEGSLPFDEEVVPHIDFDRDELSHVEMVSTWMDVRPQGYPS